MRSDKKIIYKARKLAKLTFDSDGNMSDGRANAIIHEISTSDKSTVCKKTLLFLFAKFLKNAIDSHSLLLEHAGGMSDAVAESILKHVQLLEGKKFLLKKQRNDLLIAGVKISAGDIVLENSIKNDIYSL